MAWLTATAQAADHPQGASESRQIFEWALDLGIWTIVVFVLLIFILKKYAWGPMLEGLQKREQNLHAAVEEARKAREEAAQLREERQAALAKIGEQVREAMDEARRDAQRLKEEMQNQAKAEIQAERERLRREIAMARDQALKQLWDQAAQLATLVSAKAIQRHISEEDHRRLVDEALAELHQAGQQRQQELAGMHA
jgi:F-type H+-transporting ATPase subunit b